MLRSKACKRKLPVMKHAYRLATFQQWCIQASNPLLLLSALSTVSVSQVISRAAVTNSATDSSSEVPDCRGLGSSAVLGHLPEVLPASLMHHPALQQLQMQLLPFQVTIG